MLGFMKEDIPLIIYMWERFFFFFIFVAVAVAWAVAELEQ
jgi:hypothetical protein